jgi:hypothetical protein
MSIGVVDAFRAMLINTHDFASEKKSSEIALGRMRAQCSGTNMQDRQSY